MIISVPEKPEYTIRNQDCLEAERIMDFVQEMDVRTHLKGVGSTQQILFLSFLICKTKTCRPNCTRKVEWILNFVQEMGVRTDLQRSWFHPTKSLSEFLDLWSKDWSYLQIVFFSLFSLVQFHFSSVWLAWFEFPLISKMFFQYSNVSIRKSQCMFYSGIRTVCFVQESCLHVRNWRKRGWSSQRNFFLSFLICESKTDPMSKMFEFL